MKVIMISTDRKIVQKGSAVYERMLEYGSIFKELHIIIFATEAHHVVPYVQIAPNVFVYTTSSKDKWRYVSDAIWIGGRIIENSDDRDFTVSTQDPFETGIVGWRLRATYGTKLNIQIHTDFLSSYFKDSILNRVRVVLAKFLLPKATSIRVVSERIKKSLKPLKLKVTPVVLPIWTDVLEIENTCPLFYLHQKYPEFKHVILMVARLEKEKNFSLALSAMQHVCRVYPKTALVIVGEGSEKAKLLQEVHEKKLLKNIKFEGFQSDVIQYYKTADIFLSTSLYEGFGLSLFEAAASGCPIVTTEVGLVGSILENDISAKVCAQDDIEIAKALIELISTESERVRLKDAAQDSIKEYRISKSQYLKLYKKSLG